MDTTDIISLISRVKEKVNRFIIAKMLENGIEGIVTSHGDIIYALFSRQKMTMAEIAEKIDRDKSTVTALVNKLVQFGYVTKERDTLDTRVIYAELTEKGKELKPVFDLISREVLEEFYFNITEEEKKELFRILEKIYNNF